MLFSQKKEQDILITKERITAHMMTKVKNLSNDVLNKVDKEIYFPLFYVLKLQVKVNKFQVTSGFSFFVFFITRKKETKRVEGKEKNLLFSFFHVHHHHHHHQSVNKIKSHATSKILRHSRGSKMKKIKRNMLTAFIWLIDCYLLYEIFSCLYESLNVEGR